MSDVLQLSLMATSRPAVLTLEQGEAVMQDVPLDVVQPSALNDCLSKLYDHLWHALALPTFSCALNAPNDF